MTTEHVTDTSAYRIVVIQGKGPRSVPARLVIYRNQSETENVIGAVHRGREEGQLLALIDSHRRTSLLIAWERLAAKVAPGYVPYVVSRSDHARWLYENESDPEDQDEVVKRVAKALESALRSDDAFQRAYTFQRDLASFWDFEGDMRLVDMLTNEKHDLGEVMLAEFADVAAAAKMEQHLTIDSPYWLTPIIRKHHEAARQGSDEASAPRPGF